jgi:Pyruvate/2-oxoacid:ferredoxin oxidoreductase gamma subunit
LGVEKFGKEIFGNMIALGRLMNLVGLEVSDEELAKVLPLKYKEENINAVHFGYYLKEEDLERGTESRKRREFDFSSEQPGAVELEAES